jgi:hypothetical protein
VSETLMQAAIIGRQFAELLMTLPATEREELVASVNKRLMAEAGLVLQPIRTPGRGVENLNRSRS